MLALAIGSVVFGSALAGDLEPPGPPAPTMVTLQEIYDLVQSQGGASGSVAKTGQTLCWNASGGSVPCSGTGQDGEYQYGVAASPRFVDNSDGTIRDNLTGLTWLKNANCFGVRTWATALADANNLAAGVCGLSDGSSVGDWRLPNVRELHSLVDYQQFDPSLPAGHPFTGVQVDRYWTATTFSGWVFGAWYVLFDGGLVSRDTKTFAFYVWPVRSQE
jgi:hypothetical protein